MCDEEEMERCKEQKKTEECTLDISADLLRLVLYGKTKVTSSSVQALDLIEKHRFPEEFLQNFPKQVQLCPSSIPGETLGIFATIWIKEGTEMGPFVGRIRQKSDIDLKVDNKWMWEVLGPNGSVSHFVDAAEVTFRSWISYVQCARNDEEQNLDVIQVGEEIYYRAKRAICPGQELLVWYSASQGIYMGIPSEETIESTKVTASCNSLKGAQHEVASTSALESCISGRLKCVVCKRGFNSRSNLRSHMRIHTLEKPFVCKFCQRCFSQSSTLRNHIRLHTGEKPYKCLVCHSAYSQLAGLRAHQKSARHRPALAPAAVPTTAESASLKRVNDATVASVDEKKSVPCLTSTVTSRPLVSFTRTSMSHVPKDVQRLTIVQHAPLGIPFQCEPLPLVTTSR